MKNVKVGIIGGGLAGLSAAYYLSKAQVNCTILEARSRLGGRILTQYSEASQVELGATWLGKKHTNLVNLLEDLDIGIFEQYMGSHAVYDPISTSPPQLVQMPTNDEPTYRIRSGSSKLIEALASKVDNAKIFLDVIVQEIKIDEEEIKVLTDKEEFNFDYVICTLPPKLFIRTIKTTPALSSEINDLCDTTHTWMSESIKVALTYSTPFWKSEHPIGSIFSNTGIVTEMYDHSDYAQQKFALKGFINGGYAYTTKEERLQRILIQLSKYFGNQVKEFIRYDEMIWRNESFTHFDYDQFILPHQNNGNPIFANPQLGGRLFLSGSETAKMHPGYMDGAVESGKFSAEQIIQHTK